ncbi:MAG: hypothetical protein CL764_03825 [Chloroflexi bacterium]|nr:hypothetical protein [Chloroflexota bacterium]
MKFFKKSLFFILIFSIIFSVVPVNDLHADEPTQRIVVIDDNSLVHSEDVDMTLSLLTALISSSIDEMNTDVFIGSSDLGKRLPRSLSKSDLSQLRNYLTLSSNQGNNFIYDGYNLTSDLISFLSNNEVPSGTEIFWFTRGFNSSENKVDVSLVSQLFEPFSNNEWRLKIVSLPTSTQYSREVMQEISKSANGHFFDVISLEHFSLLLEKITNISMEKQLDNFGKPNTKSFTSVSIPPSSSSFSVNIIRDKADMVGEIFDPLGQKINKNQQNVDIIETPNLVMINIDNPEPGNWMVQSISEDNSRISIFSKVQHHLNLNLLNEPPIPVGEEYRIFAELKIRNEISGLNGSWIDAVVTWSDNATEVFQLKDDGLLTDEKANDGVFSGVIDTRKVQGINNVDLNLNWADIGTILVVSDSFKTEYYPVVEIQTNEKLDFYPDNEVEIARINITKDGYPYLTKSENINAILKDDLGENVDVVISPLRNIDQDKAWEFLIKAFPKKSGQFDLQVSLNEEYLGRNYKFDTSKFPLSFELKILETPVPYMQYISWTLISLMIISSSVYGFWRFRLPNPRGVLIDSNGELIVDFSNVKRKLWRKIIYPNIVYSTELDNLLIENIRFLFSTDNAIYLIFDSDTSSLGLRINSKPARVKNLLTEDTSIGMGGKLYYFSPTVTESSELWARKTV